VPMIDLTPTQSASRITMLLESAENRTLDFKRISAKHGRMIETVCAFANSDGGVLAIGVSDAKDLKPGAKLEGRLYGVEENAEAFDDFRRQVMNRFSPPVTRLQWLRLPCTLNNGQPGHVVLLRVEKSDQVHSVVGDGTWTRMDASNRELVISVVCAVQRARRCPFSCRCWKRRHGALFKQRVASRRAPWLSNCNALVWLNP
jgi:ATP-dependent DNA helicase RecG